MYDAYSTPTMWPMVLCCALYQCQLVLPVLLFTSELWKGWVVGPCPWHLQKLFLVRLWVLVLLLTNLYRQHCSGLMYILSYYATDWPGLSVGRPAGALACFVGGFFDMSHQAAWRPCLVLVLEHQHQGFVRSCVMSNNGISLTLKGHDSAFSHSQTIGYSKIPLKLAKKGPF